MNKKRLFAGFLSAAMLVSVMPVSVLAEGTAEDKYLYHETFDGVTYDTIFDTPKGSAWTATREKGYMKYNYTNASAENIGEYFIDKDLGITLEANKWYEIGFKVQYNTTLESLTITMPVKNDSKTNEKLYVKNEITGENNGGKFCNWDQWFKAGTWARNDKWLTLVERFYTDSNGQFVQYVVFNDGKYGCVPNVDSNKCSWAGKLGYAATNVGIKIGNATSSVKYPVTEAAAESYANGRGILIDDVYVKEINTAPTITLNLNGHGDNYTVSPNYNTILELPTPTADGYSFLGWYYDEALTKKVDAKISCFEDSTFYAKWIKNYNITFNTDGGTEIADQTVNEGSKVVMPEDPTKEGHLFVDWYTDPEFTTVFNRDTKVTSDMTLYAKWSADADNVIIKLHYGDTTEDIKVVKGETRLPKKEVENAGAFMGWYTDESLTNRFTSATEETTDLYAKFDTSYYYYEDFEYQATGDFDATTWAKGKGWTNEVVTSGGNSAMQYVNPDIFQNINGNIYLKNITAPALDLENGSKYKFGFKLKADSMTSHIEFTLNNKKQTLAKFNMVPGGTVRIEKGNVYVPKVNIINVGDFVDVSGIFSIDKTNKKVNLTMGFDWVKDGVSYHEKLENPISISDANLIALAASTDYTFTAVNFANASSRTESKFAIDNIYFQKLASDVKVTFNANDGTFSDGEATKVIDSKSGVVELPEEPTRSGYHFDGWFNADGSQFNPRNVSAACEVSAKWTKIYTVTFKTNGGEAVSPIDTYTGEITLPTPVKNGFPFLGWFTDSELTNEFDGKNITSDMTVYAKWAVYTGYEDFESESYAQDFNKTATSSTDGFISQRVQRDDGNWVMKYSTEKDNDFGETIVNHAFSGLKFKADSNAYEFGFKLDPAKIDTVLNFKLITEARIKGTQTNANKTLLHMFLNPGQKNIKMWGNIIQGINYTDINGLADVRFVLNSDDETMTCTVYIDYDDKEGNHQQITYEGTSAKIDETAYDYTGITYFEIGSALGANGGTAIVGTEFYIDDVYLRPIVRSKATFNPNGGMFSDGSTEPKTVETNASGLIDESAIPADPIKENYTFAGWFTNEDLTVPFDNNYISKDTTIYARWQSEPHVVSITPDNGSANVSVRPEILVSFDSEMKKDTVTKDNFVINNGSFDIDKNDYTVEVILDGNRHTVAKITFKKNLEFNRNYTVTVKSAIANLHSSLTVDTTSAFTTAGLKLTVTDASVKDSEGNAVTDLSRVSGKEVTVSFKVNHNGTTVSVPFTSVYSFRNGNALKNAQAQTGATAENEKETGVSATLTVPEGATALDMIMLDDLSTLKPLTVKTDIVK